jgi:all-trans-retinol 13,14-reductase
MASQSYPTFKISNAAQKQFDAIIIGSGTGGLSIASLLAQAGKKILLLEQHHRIGGYSHAFQRQGYTWDVGLHYVGQVHIPGTLLNKVFRYITKEQLEWAPLDDVYDRVVFGETEYQFPRGRQNLMQALKRYFPDRADHDSIDAYFKLLDEVANVSIGYYIEKVMPPFLAKIFGGWLRRGVLKYSDKTTLKVLRGLTSNKKLIGVLTAQYGDYGLQPKESSFYMHAVLANHYMEGAGYPVGGAPRLAETVIPVIEAAGGAVVFAARVKQILVENNRAVGVLMEDGGQLRSKLVISDAGVVNTFANLLSPEVNNQHQLNEKLQNLTPSLAHMGLYVGIKEDNTALKLPKCNYWVFPDEYDHALLQSKSTSLESPLPVAFASFPSAKDPHSNISHPGRTTAEVIILVPFDWFKQWDGTKKHQRGEDYEAVKKQMAEKMFEILYRVAPQLRGKVDYFEVSSPLSAKHYVGHPSGEIYGTAHTPKRFRQTFLKPHTPVKNLYLTGQDAMIASISGGVMGGVLCASAILKKNLLWTIDKKIKS